MAGFQEEVIYQHRLDLAHGMAAGLIHFAEYFINVLIIEISMLRQMSNICGYYALKDQNPAIF